MNRINKRGIIAVVGFLISSIGIGAHALNPKHITYRQHDGIFIIEPTMDLWPQKESYPFGDYFVFVQFSPPPGQKANAQFQIMLQKKALPKNSTITVNTFAQDYASKMRADRVASGPIRIDNLKISGYDARRVQYAIRGPGAKPVVLTYNFIVVERRVFALVYAALQEELANYQPIFDKMLDSFKLNTPIMTKVLTVRD